MHRKTTGIILCAGTLLISGPGIFAASDTLRPAGAGGSAVHNAYADGNEKRQAARLAEKNLAVTAQGSGLRDVALRFPSKETPPSRLRQEQMIDGDAGSGSWFAMLVAGFGVALVSILRRMGNLQ